MLKRMLALVLLVGLSACSGAPLSDPNANNGILGEYQAKIGKYGGQLLLSTTSDPKTFNPIVANESSSLVVTGYIFEGLTRTSGITTAVEPHLAKSWELSEDGKTWTFRLREDVQWFDGEPFTAADVVFTFNQLIYNDAIPNSARDIFTVEGEEFLVEELAKDTVRFTLPKKFAPFLRSMSQPILPEHVLQTVVEQGEFSSTWGVDTAPEQLIGTGPFKLKIYQAGQRLVFERNANYWRKDEVGNKLPYLDGISYLIVQNLDVSLLKFQEGALDYYSLRGSDFPLLKPAEAQDNFTVYRLGPTFTTTFVTFNQNPGKNPSSGQPYLPAYKLKWFQDLAFRQAVAYAIDRQGMINIVLNGLGQPQWSAMSPSSGYFYNGAVSEYPYDLAQARRILASAGYEDSDGDGIREDKDGNPVEFNFFTNSDNTERVKIAGLIRKDLEELGFKVHFTPLEFNNLVSKLLENYEWDMMMIGLGGDIEPHFASNVWLSSANLHMWYPKQAVAATAWEQEVDQIFTAGVQELAEAKRKKLYDRWQEIVAEQLPLIYTVLPESIMAVRNKFGNLYPTAYGGAFHNLEEIYLAE